jgi:hypothetical protein
MAGSTRTPPCREHAGALTFSVIWLQAEQATELGDVEHGTRVRAVPDARVADSASFRGPRRRRRGRQAGPELVLMDPCLVSVSLNATATAFCASVNW